MRIRRTHTHAQLYVATNPRNDHVPPACSTALSTTNVCMRLGVSPARSIVRVLRISTRSLSHLAHARPCIWDHKSMVLRIYIQGVRACLWMFWFCSRHRWRCSCVCVCMQSTRSKIAICLGMLSCPGRSTRM